MPRVAEVAASCLAKESASQEGNTAARVTARSLPPRMIGPACMGQGQSCFLCTVLMGGIVCQQLWAFAQSTCEQRNPPQMGCM